MNILIVEDEAPAIQAYEDNIESFNKTSEITIVPTICRTLDEAMNLLLNPIFDAAIIDLKLSDNKIELEGLTIIEEIRNNLVFPIFIVSGSLGQVDHLEENLLFRKKSRDDDYKTILVEIVSIYNTGITKILGKKGQIDMYLNKIFWEHLANSMDLWITDNKRNPKEKQKSLLRYTLLHIQEYLELTEDSDFEYFHPSEIYITPAIKENLFTGDIVTNKIDCSSYIVLTPSCDLAQSKAKDILLVSIENENLGLLKEKINIIKKNTATQEILLEAEDSLKKLINNSYSNKYHFMPKYKHLDAGLINFQKVISIRIKDFKDNFKVIATVNSSFTKDIVARFSYYYSRQGSPDFNTDEVLETLLK